MKRKLLSLLFILITTLWGCHTKHIIPSPHPEPEVSELIILHSEAQFIAQDWLEIIEFLQGTAPIVGPGPWFFEMTA